MEQLRSARQSGEATESLIEALEAFREQIADKRKDYEEQLGRAFLEWDSLILNNGSDEERQQRLSKLADIISQSAYIRNLERDIEDEVSQ